MQTNKQKKTDSLLCTLFEEVILIGIVAKKDLLFMLYLYLLFMLYLFILLPLEVGPVLEYQKKYYLL